MLAKLVLGMLLGCGGPLAAQPNVEEVVAEDHDASQALERTLRERINLDERAGPLREVIDRWAKQHKLTIRFDDAAIRNAGLTAEGAVTNGLRNFTLRAAITKVLEEHGLAFRIVRGELLIGPPTPRVVEPPAVLEVRAVQVPRVKFQPLRLVRVQPVMEFRWEEVPVELVNEVNGREDDVADEPAEEMQVPQRRLRISDATFDLWAFGPHRNAGDARRQLEARLTMKINNLNKTCGLTDSQRQKLELAGRGEIARYFQRMEELKRQFQADREDQAKLMDLFPLIQGVSLPLRMEATDDGSMFSKVIRRVLTDEQAEMLGWKPGTPTVQ
ncbi:MAG: hypothetical protein ACKV0T_29090 [Planctomycetales bacterium]